MRMALRCPSQGEASIVVSAAVDKDHAEAALKVLSTPDTLLTLVLGGDHIRDGIEAIHAALENPILRPHYAYIEAKRLAERFGRRKPNLKAAADLIDDTTITSPLKSKKQPCSSRQVQTAQLLTPWSASSKRKSRHNLLAESCEFQYRRVRS
jgi:hypothetical protein